MLFSTNSLFIFLFPHLSACIRFFNRTPDYVLATQHRTESHWIAYHSKRVSSASIRRNALQFFVNRMASRISMTLLSHLWAFMRCISGWLSSESNGNNAKNSAKILKGRPKHRYLGSKRVEASRGFYDGIEPYSLSFLLVNELCFHDVRIQKRRFWWVRIPSGISGIRESW